MSRDKSGLNIAEIKSYEAWLRGIAWRILGNHADVDDVMQDFWLAELRQVDDREKKRAWFGSVVRNISVSRVRRRLRRRDIEGIVARPEQLDESVHDVIQEADFYKHILNWILELDQTYKEVLLLRYARGLEPKEISERLCIPSSTVRVRLKRGLAILRARLDESFDNESRGALGLLLFGEAFRRPVRSLTSVISTVSLILMVPIVLFFWWQAPLSDESSAIPATEVVSESSRMSPRGHKRTNNRIPSQTPTTVDRTNHPFRHNLSGKIEVTLRGEPIDWSIHVDVVPYMVGKSLDFPAIKPRHPRYEDGYTFVSSATVANSEYFHIPVVDPGRYRLMISVDRVKGALEYWASTDRMAQLKIELLENPRLLHAPQSSGEFKIRWRTASGVESRSLDFSGATTQATGLFLPGFQLQWIDVRNDQAWRTLIIEPESTIEFPRSKVAVGLEFHDSNTQLGVEGVTVELHLWFENKQTWVSRIEVRDPLHPEIRLPELSKLKRGILHVEAPGYYTKKIDLNDRFKTNSIDLVPMKLAQGRLTHAQGGPVAGATIFGTFGKQVIWQGASRSNGEFDLDVVLMPRVAPKDGDTIQWWVFRNGRPLGKSTSPIRDGRVSVELPKSQTTEFVIRAEDGAMINNAELIAVPLEGTPVIELVSGKKLKVDQNGLVHLRDLAGGEWLFEIHAEGYQPKAYMVSPQDGASVLMLLKPQDEVPRQTRFAVVESNGSPLASAVILLQNRGMQQPLEQRSDRFGLANYSLFDEQGLSYDVLFPGLSPSLRTNRFTSINGSVNQVVMMPMTEVPCHGVPVQTADTWVICSPISAEFGRRRVFGHRSGVTLPLTQEEQSVLFLQQGYLPSSVRYDTSMASLTVSCQLGPKLTIVDLQPGDEIELTPFLSSIPADHRKRIQASLRLLGTATSQSLEWQSVLPGKYTLSVKSRSGAMVSDDLDVTTDTVVSFAKIFPKSETER